MMRLFHGSKREFDRFKCDGLGSHFGNEAQCLHAPGGSSLVYEVTVGIERPLPLPDMYSWDPYDLATILQERCGVDLEDLIHSICLAHGDPEKDQGFYDQLKDVIEQQGYDGIVYDNSMEGHGVSYIAFRPEQVSIVARRTREEHCQLFPHARSIGIPSMQHCIDNLDQTLSKSSGLEL